MKKFASVVALILIAIQLSGCLWAVGGALIGAGAVGGAILACDVAPGSGPCPDKK